MDRSSEERELLEVPVERSVERESLEEGPAGAVPEPLPPAEAHGGIRPLDANRAILFLLVAPSLLITFFSAFLGPGPAIAMGSLSTLLLLFVVFREPMRLISRDPWLRTPPRFGVVLGSTLLAFFASRGVLVFMSSVAPGLLEQTLPYDTLLDTRSSLTIALTFLGVAVLVPLYEELVFRGLALRAYGRVRSYLFAACFTASLFAVVHVLPAQVFPILPLGFILARAVQSAGSFWTAVLVHIFNNGLAVAILVYLSLANIDVEALAGEQQDVTLGVGLFGLALAALCVFIAVRWLKVPEDGVKSGPLWSGSLWTVLVISLASLLGIIFGVREMLP